MKAGRNEMTLAQAGQAHFKDLREMGKFLD